MSSWTSRPPGWIPAGSREIQDLILELKRQGITVLLSSHLLGQVQEVCDRVGILAEGVLVREGRLEELLGIKNQTEILLEHSSPRLIEEIVTVAEKAGARVVEQRKSKTTLERLFLEATRNREGNAETEPLQKRPTSNVQRSTFN